MSYLEDKREMLAELVCFGFFVYRYPKKLYLCCGSLADYVPPTYRNTKRYARLVNENVGNFHQSCKDSIMVRAALAWTFILFATWVSYDLHSQKDISVPRFFCIICPFRCWKGNQ